MVYFVAFLIGFLAAQNQTQATEGTVFTACEDTTLPGVVCTQKYQTKSKLTDEVKLPEPTSKDPQNTSRN